MIPILMIALEFAPVQTTGAFRSVDFARNLPALGYQPIVITIDVASGADIFQAPVNEAMLEGIPAEVEIHRLQPDRARKTESRLGQGLRLMTSLDDRFFQRFRGALEASLKDIARRHTIQAVYVSAPPFGAARLGEQAADFLNVPYLLDMRDAWAEWGMAPYSTYLHYWARRTDEARAFRRATAVVTVTDRLRDLFRRCHPAQPTDKFGVIANGFSGEAIVGGRLSTLSGKETYDVAYVGSYYYTPPRPRSWRRPHAYLHYARTSEDWSYRSPLYFFKAWEQLEILDPRAARRLRYHHVGDIPSWLGPMAKDHGVFDRCVFHGRLMKQDVDRVLPTMDAQLATSMKRPDGGDYCLASKTFDYLRARRPILAFVTEGSQRDFLDESGAAILCNPDDPKRSAQILKAAIDNGIDLDLNSAFLNTFHRQESARQLAALLDRLISAAGMASGSASVTAPACGCILMHPRIPPD